TAEVVIARRFLRGGRDVQRAGAVADRILQITSARLEDLLDAIRIVHTERNHQRGGRGDVGGGHRRALEWEEAGPRRIAARDGVLEDAVGDAVFVEVDARVAAGRRDVELFAIARVERELAVRTKRAHGNGAVVCGGVLDFLT